MFAAYTITPHFKVVKDRLFLLRLSVRCSFLRAASNQSKKATFDFIVEVTDGMLGKYETLEITFRSYKEMFMLVGLLLNAKKSENQRLWECDVVPLSASLRFTNLRVIGSIPNLNAGTLF